MFNQNPIMADQWSALGSMLTGLATIVLAIIAAIGIRQWYVQLSGTNKYELARKLAFLAIKFRNQFAIARHPFTSAQESTDRPRQQNETIEQQGILNEHFARSKRLEPLQNTWQEMQVTAWEAEIILGSETGEFIEPFRVHFSKLAAAVNVYFNRKYSRVTRKIPEFTDEEIQLMQKLSNTIYSNGEDDDISKELDEAVNSLKAFLQKYIK